MSAQHVISIGAYRPVRRKQHARVLRAGFGRDPRFTNGWWILPATTFGLAIWIGFFALIL